MVVMFSKKFESRLFRFRIAHQSRVREARAASIAGMFDGSHLPLEFFRHPRVIGIQKCDVLALGVLDSQVSSGAGPAVRLAEIADLSPIFQADRFLFNEALNRCARPVGGTVIGNDDFQVGVSLRQDAFDGRNGFLGSIVCRDYNRD